MLGAGKTVLPEEDYTKCLSLSLFYCFYFWLFLNETVNENFLNGGVNPVECF